MLLAFRVRDFDQIFRAQARGLRQHRSGDSDLVVVGKTPDNGWRRLRDRSKLTAHFGKRNTGTDIRDRPQLDRVDQAIKYTVEQLDLLIVEGAGGRQKKIFS